MRFEWDENKRLQNLRKHGLDFRDAESVLDQETYRDVDERFAYGEQRFYTIGILSGMTVVISHTETPDLIRIISFRNAEKNEE